MAAALSRRTMYPSHYKLLTEQGGTSRVRSFFRDGHWGGKELYVLFCRFFPTTKNIIISQVYECVSNLLATLQNTEPKRTGRSGPPSTPPPEVPVANLSEHYKTDGFNLVADRCTL